MVDASRNLALQEQNREFGAVGTLLMLCDGTKTVYDEISNFGCSRWEDRRRAVPLVAVENEDW